MPLTFNMKVHVSEMQTKTVQPTFNIKVHVSEMSEWFCMRSLPALRPNPDGLWAWGTCAGGFGQLQNMMISSVISLLHIFRGDNATYAKLLWYDSSRGVQTFFSLLQFTRFEAQS